MQLVIYGQPGPVPLLGAAARAAQLGGLSPSLAGGTGVSELFWLWVVLLPAWLSPGNNSPRREAPCAVPGSV